MKKNIVTLMLFIFLASPPSLQASIFSNLGCPAELMREHPFIGITFFVGGYLIYNKVVNKGSNKEEFFRAIEVDNKDIVILFSMA